MRPAPHMGAGAGAAGALCTPAAAALLLPPSAGALAPAAAGFGPAAMTAASDEVTSAPCTGLTALALASPL